MAQPSAPTINLASVVYGLDAYMRSRGADAGEALRRAGLEPGDLTDPDRRLPLIRYLELLEICADVLADRQFGLKFGAQYEPRRAGVVGNVALASRTLGEAFRMSQLANFDGGFAYGSRKREDRQLYRSAPARIVG